MNHHVQAMKSDLPTLPSLPQWVTKGLEEAPQNVAFLSGASLSVLDAILRRDDGLVPHNLLSRTLAFKAAVATSRLEGRMSTEADIRDAYYLTPQGSDGGYQWGPDGDCLGFWRRAARLRLDGSDWIANLQDCLEAADADQVEDWVRSALAAAAADAPLSASVAIMCEILAANDRDERLACFLSDVVLAKSLSWRRPLPLTSLHLTKATLRALRYGTKRADVGIQLAVLKSVQAAVRLAHQVASRADALREITPRLRSRGADDAVAVFLSENIVSPPNMLAPVIQGTQIEMSPRNARRLCDRLVELGVVRELTGRSTFRLYGVGV